jgi:transcriptional regulator GlxA family with amidase domain
MYSQHNQRYKAIVDRVQQIARAQFGETLHIHFICLSCGVNERTLRKAFQSVCGSTPYRYLREVRMREAREALLRAGPRTKVTTVAMEHGFLELGRFSVEYKMAFGERPSETLRRAISGNHSHPQPHAPNVPVQIAA